MVQTHKASATAAEKNATPNGSEAVSRGVAEELTALRAIVEGTAHDTGEEFFQTLVRHLARAVVRTDAGKTMVKAALAEQDYMSFKYSCTN
jgi:hypothetical protein